MIDTREQKVLDLIDANQQDVIDYLRDLLAFETIALSIMRWSRVRESAGK
jgi:hypothetical protein